MEDIRLQKYLAECGVASRRGVVAIVSAGRVAVNGKIVKESGSRIRPDLDVVTVDGSTVTPLLARRTIRLYKPRGYVCSRAGQGSRTVYQLLAGIRDPMVPAGRLDKDSEGLLLMSTDGNLVNRLTHPRFGHKKEYRVTVSGRDMGTALEKLREPMEIEGRQILPSEVSLLKPAEKSGRFILKFILYEGRNRQIRRLCSHAGLTVHRLIRVKVGDITLAGLKPGQWRDLTDGELKKLKS